MAGGVSCWGDNAQGQLGDGTTIDRHTPVPIAGHTPGSIVLAYQDRLVQPGYRYLDGLRLIDEREQRRRLEAVRPPREARIGDGEGVACGLEVAPLCLYLG